MEISLTIINEITYNNIWNAFKKWIEDQTELGYLIQVFPLGSIFYSKEKLNEGISMKISDLFLKDNELKWDENKFSFEKIPDENLNGANAEYQKLNLIYISSSLNLPKIYVQKGLNNLFSALGELLKTNDSCNVNLGSLGSLYCENKTLSHSPVKVKKETMFNNRVSVRGLLLKSLDRNLAASHQGYLQTSIGVEENNRYFTLLNKSNANNSLKMSDSQNLDLDNTKTKLKIPKHLMNSLNNQNGSNISTNLGHSLDLPNGPKNFMNFKQQISLNNSSELDIGFLEKMKLNVKTLNPSYLEGNSGIKGDSAADYQTTVKSKSNLLQESTNSNFNSSNLKQLIQKIVSVPIQDPDWLIKEMVGAIFQKKEKVKKQNFPVLFNAYSNTLAAPFTSEKTYIPISHRIGSFYSLSLQNYVIDKTTKGITRLFDEYFYKYKNILLDVPANEEEEYLALLNLYKNTKKVDLRKETYERYQNYILTYIPDEIIAPIKEEWLVNVVKMCMRAYNLKNSELYNELLNNCIREIVFIYKISMKQSILDYILKHPEQREKLSIPVSFRKMKEYAQEVIIRPSDENAEWKKKFNIAKIKISTNLMLMCENVTKIKKYYVQSVQKSQYLEIPNHWNAYSLSSFIDNQRAKIEEEKKLVSEDWKKFIESALKENNLYKDQLILYFKSVCGLMSSQLRKLVLLSIKNYHDFLLLFKKDTYYDPKKIFEEQFNPKFPFQRSFLELSIKPSSDRLSFVFSDELSDIHNKLIGVIHDVIKCSQDVDRPDNAFIKNLERKNTLWEVPVVDPKIANMIAVIDLIIKENLDHVNKVTDIYEPFLFVLNEQQELEIFKSSNPKREDIKKKIAYYEEKFKILRENMPNSLYLNLIRIDCTDINLELRFSLYNFIVDLLKYVQTKNIVQKAKDLTERIDALKDNLDRVPADEETLYMYETNLESYKNDKVPGIYNEYNDFLEWVFFYFDYDRYPIFPDSSKGESMGGIDTIIRNINNIIKFIPAWMETFESILKDKRNIFETQLNKTRSEFYEELRKITAEIQQNRANANTLLLDDGFILALLKIEKDIENTYVNLQALVKKEELLGAYPTDDEKLEQCKKDLLPLIYYVQFVNELKEQMENESLEIKNIDFPKLQQFIEKSNDVFEYHVTKLNNLRNHIAKNRERFEAIKFGAEFGRLVFILIEIIRFEHINKDIAELMEENKLYCIEFTKIVYDHERGQDYLKHLKLIDFMRKKELIEKNREHRTEIDKIIEEWENVKNMHEVITKVAKDCEMRFKWGNFRDKKFIVIQQESYKEIKDNIHKNIKTLEDCVAEKDIFRYSTRTLTKLHSFKSSLLELLDIIEHLEINQINLEKHMLRANSLQKNHDMFMKLKQAESYYKSVIDHIQENPKVMELLRVKESIIDTNISLHKVLNELPHNEDQHKE